MLLIDTIFHYGASLQTIGIGTNRPVVEEAKNGDGEEDKTCLYNLLEVMYHALKTLLLALKSDTIDPWKRLRRTEAALFKTCDEIIFTQPGLM